ncbi:MAG: hypothetical protein E7012_05535 [Alphaproteobacteria bacterium]|nr:hypothetical protein [Alphaproteobacteria bacterium]
MFSDKDLMEPKLIQEIERNILLEEINPTDGIFFNSLYTDVRTIRSYIYKLLKKAKNNLPEGYNFVIYEAYRPMYAQVELWNNIVAQNHKLYPSLDINSEEFITLCDRYVANPYRQGSGHQSGAAVDISLADNAGVEYDMGGCVRGFDDSAEFTCANISPQARNNRQILKKALSDVGFVNYPSEWWHYSFGDRLWAKLTGSPIAIFGKLDI